MTSREWNRGLMCDTATLTDTSKLGVLYLLSTTKVSEIFNFCVDVGTEMT